MSHRPWPGDETGRAKLTSSEIALQEQPVQPHRDTPVQLSQLSPGCCSPLHLPTEDGLSRHFGICWEAVQMCMWTRIQPSSSPWQQLPGLVVALGAGGCPWGRWLPTGLVIAHGAGDCPRGWWLPMGLMDERSSDHSLHPNPVFLHTQRRLANLRALYCNDIWSSTVSINRIFASDITYCGI